MMCPCKAFPMIASMVILLGIPGGCTQTKIDSGTERHAPTAGRLDPDRQIQHAMSRYIEDRIFKGTYYYYDQIESRLLRLEFDQLDHHVQPKGNFFVSRADFRDQFGRNVGLDIFVMKGDKGYRVTQGLLRKIDDKQRDYDLDAQ